jgi:hypothetical protein
MTRRLQQYRSGSVSRHPRPRRSLRNKRLHHLHLLRRPRPQFDAQAAKCPSAIVAFARAGREKSGVDALSRPRMRHRLRRLFAPAIPWRSRADAFPVRAARGKSETAASVSRNLHLDRWSAPATPWRSGADAFPVRAAPGRSATAANVHRHHRLHLHPWSALEIRLISRENAFPVRRGRERSATDANGSRHLRRKLCPKCRSWKRFPVTSSVRAVRSRTTKASVRCSKDPQQMMAPRTHCELTFRIKNRALSTHFMPVAIWSLRT